MKRRIIEKEIASQEELNDFGRELIEEIEKHRIVAFYGNLGAGKTTFIKSLVRLLGSEDEVSSPTFSIINEYAKSSGKLIYHFDFYRLKDIEEAYDMGYEEYFYSRQICLIEWPEKIEEILPQEYLSVSIKITGDSSRLILVDEVIS